MLGKLAAIVAQGVEPEETKMERRGLSGTYG